MIKKVCKMAGCPNFIERGETYCTVHKNRKRLCKMAGCPNFVTVGAYCAEHAQQAAYDKKRAAKHKSNYNGTWRKLATAKLKANPLCELCTTQNRTTPACLVHHIKPLADGGDKLIKDNLMSVCAACHARLHSLLKFNLSYYFVLIQDVLSLRENNNNVC